MIDPAMEGDKVDRLEHQKARLKSKKRKLVDALTITEKEKEELATINKRRKLLKVKMHVKKYVAYLAEWFVVIPPLKPKSKLDFDERFKIWEAKEKIKEQRRIDFPDEIPMEKIKKPIKYIFPEKMMCWLIEREVEYFVESGCPAVCISMRMQEKKDDVYYYAYDLKFRGDFNGNNHDSRVFPRLIQDYGSWGFDGIDGDLKTTDEELENLKIYSSGEAISKLINEYENNVSSLEPSTYKEDVWNFVYECIRATCTAKWSTEDIDQLGESLQEKFDRFKKPFYCEL